MKLWKSITDNSNHCLFDLLPPERTRQLRNRGHNYILPRIRTERFKSSFINRCLFLNLFKNCIICIYYIRIGQCCKLARFVAQYDLLLIKTSIYLSMLIGFSYSEIKSLNKNIVKRLKLNAIFRQGTYFFQFFFVL